MQISIVTDSDRQLVELSTRGRREKVMREQKNGKTGNMITDGCEEAEERVLEYVCSISDGVGRRS
jgi:hypothetical protein